MSMQKQANEQQWEALIAAATKGIVNLSEAHIEIGAQLDTYGKHVEEHRTNATKRDSAIASAAENGLSELEHLQEMYEKEAQS